MAAGDDQAKSHILLDTEQEVVPTPAYLTASLDYLKSSLLSLESAVTSNNERHPGTHPP